jgi:hypothetical protein
MRRGYPTILEIRTEEKIVGGFISGRQLVYIAVASIQAYFLVQLSGWVAATFFKGIEVVSYTFFGTIACSLGAIILIIGFVPAGFWILPGPTFKLSRDPYEPLTRLDQWFFVMWNNAKKTKVLPYRRGKATKIGGNSVE